MSMLKRSNYGLFLGILCLTTSATAHARLPLYTQNFENSKVAGGVLQGGVLGQTVRYVTGDAHGGTHSLQVDTGAWVGPRFAVQRGAYYHVRFFRKNAAPGLWAIFFYDAQGRLMEGDNYAVAEPASAWTQTDLYFQTKAPARSACLVLQAPLRADDIVISRSTAGESRGWLETITKTMPPIPTAPPSDFQSRIPRAMAKLRGGPPLHILLIGDSISNDLSNSLFETLLARAYPQARIDIQWSGRGGTAWTYFETQVPPRILARRPDLVICLAISNAPDQIQQPLQSIIDQTKHQLPQTEFVLVTPHIPGVGAYTREALSLHRDALLRVAAANHLATIDMLPAWDEYVAHSGHDVGWLKRDALHLNARGRAFFAHFVASAFAPEK